MRVVLAYPPDFNRPTMIFGGLPLFNACLKNHGHEPLIVDINGEAFTAMLQPENLDRYFGLLDDVVGRLRSKEREDWEEADLRTYERLYVFPREQMATARQCAEDMRDPAKFYDPEQYVHMDRVVRTAHAFLHSFTPSLDPRNTGYTDFLYAWLRDDRPDPYYDYYENHLLKRLGEFQPELIALSCPFSPQVGTGMYFAKHLKRHLPDTKIVMGGTGMSDHTELLLENPDFYDYVDFGIVGDGEEALPGLVSVLEGRSDFDEVAGLWRRESNGEVIKPSFHKNVNMDESPTPDYTDVDFTHYMLPEKAGIYTTSRGCYYGKCTFCPESFRAGFRKRSPKNVVKDMRALATEQGVQHIHFFDPLTPPVTLEYMSRAIAKEDIPVHWYAEVKFENIYTNKEYVKKLAAGGCRQLQFGYESGVQRVLDDMVKGNRLDMMEIILDNLQEAGISVAVTWFIGFPTELEDDARETWRFMRRHWDQMHLSLYTGTFGLGADVPVFYTPESYGIEIIRDEVGNPSYRRLDGDDWDQEPLHETFQSRTDIIMSMSGAGLLYAAHHPERLYEIRSVNAVGPTSFDEPALSARRCRVGRENHWIELASPEAGEEPYLLYVAAAGETFPADATDIALLERIGDGLELSELLDDPAAPADIEERLRRFVDRGVIESPDPILQSAPA